MLGVPIDGKTVAFREDRGFAVTVLLLHTSLAADFDSGQQGRPRMGRQQDSSRASRLRNDESK